MTTIAYRQVLERQRTDTLRREEGYPLSLRQIDMMVERYAAKREQAFAKRGLATQRHFILALGRQERRFTRIFAEELATQFNALGRLAATAFREIDELALKAALAKQDPLDEETVNQIMRRLNIQLWQQDTFVPSYENMVERIALGTVDEINIRFRLGINIPDHVMRQIVADGGTRAGLVDVSQSTRNALFRALEEGRELGEGADALARRIRDYVPEGRFRNAGANYRSRMIARTETKHAQNEATLRAYEQSDVVTGVRAWDNQTGFNDADCTERDGKIFTILEARVEESKEHPNYTLSWSPEVDWTLRTAA